MNDEIRRTAPSNNPVPRHMASAQGAPNRRPISAANAAAHRPAPNRAAPRYAASGTAMRTSPAARYGMSRRRKAERRKRWKMLFIGAGAAAAVLIALLIILLSGGRSEPAPDTAVLSSAVVGTQLTSPEPTAEPAATEGAAAALPDAYVDPAADSLAIFTPEPTAEPTEAPKPASTAGVDSISSDPVRAARASTRCTQYDGFLPVVTGANTDEKIIAITVDDCFQINNLKKIIELVMQYDGKITIFPIGQQAMRETHQPVIKAAWEAGMEIENHTYTHNGLYKCDDEELANEIYVQNYALNYILGGEYKCHFLRPKGGDARWDQRIHAYAKQMDYYGIAHWNVSGKSSSAINQIAPGAIFLFHTTDGDLAALREFIPAAAAAGYRMVTLNEMFGYDDNEFTPCEISRDMPAVPPLEPYEEVLVQLKKGTYSHSVWRLQARLKELGYSRSDPDACYGDGTKAAVTAFQRKAGLEADGIAGPATQTAIYAADAPRA